MHILSSDQQPLAGPPASARHVHVSFLNYSGFTCRLSLLSQQRACSNYMARKYTHGTTLLLAKADLCSYVRQRHSEKTLVVWLCLALRGVEMECGRHNLTAADSRVDHRCVCAKDPKKGHQFFTFLHERKQRYLL